MTPEHPWVLVAPWYRWPRKKDGPPARKPRDTAPTLQKFDTPKMAGLFTREPQRSLKFVPEIDRVYDVVKVTTPTSTGKLRDFFVGGAAYELKRNDSLWKLFLATHHRHYVVACELHCDAPGFPMVKADKVCQAGFVVRRRRYLVPAGQEKEAGALLKEVVTARAALAELQQVLPPAGPAARRRFEQIKKSRANGSFPALLQGGQQRLTDALAALDQWRLVNNVAALLEGWIPGEADNIGSWQVVEDTPQELHERVHPLYCVFPDPAIPDHTAKGRTIYYGVVPTSSLETTGRGEPSLDDDSIYELRCFVRRHKPECPRTDQVPDCHGTLFWSPPTERYRLAPPSDLLGTAQHPVTITAPDLAELAAQAKAFPIKKLASLRLKQKTPLNFKINDGKPVGGGVGIPQVCFFCIPLITIVALFVLHLFLPIVVFLFGLFFLLMLKFCIPPSFSLDAGLTAELDAVNAKIDADVSFKVDVDAFGVPFSSPTTTVTAAQFSVQLQNNLIAQSGFDGTPPKPAAAGSGLDQVPNQTLLNLTNATADAAKGPVEEAGVDLLANLSWEEIITPAEVWGP
jgi:hypothetical protein